MIAVLQRGFSYTARDRYRTPGCKIRISLDFFLYHQWQCDLLSLVPPRFWCSKDSINGDNRDNDKWDNDNWIILDIQLSDNVNQMILMIPVVPHKAVAEVSKIGNL